MTNRPALSQKPTTTGATLEGASAAPIKSICAHALDIATIVDNMVHQAHPEQYTELSSINPHFYRLLHTPKMWAKRYAPVRIHEVTRTLYTPFQPNSAHSEQDMMFCYQQRLPRQLGRYQGAPWQLQTIVFDDRFVSVKALEMLDRMGSIMGIPFGGPGQGSRAEDRFVEQLTVVRHRSLAIMRERVKSLACGEPLPVMQREDLEPILAGLAVSAIIGVYHTFCAVGIHSDPSAETGGMWHVVLLLYPLCIAGASIMGVVAQQRFTLWSLHLARLEEAVAFTSQRVV